MSTQKRCSGYYCRLKVPAELRGIFDKQELVCSLRTRRRQLAALRAAGVESRWRQLVWSVRNARGLMDEQKLKQLVAAYFRESESTGAADWLQADLSPEFVSQRKAELDAMLTDNARALALNDFSSPSIGLAIGELSQGPDWSDVDRDSLQYRKLCREVLKAHGELLRRTRARLAGEPEGSAWWQPEQPTIRTITAAPSVPLSAAIREYIAQKQAEGSWAHKTASAVKVALGALLEIVGDKSLSEITKPELADYWAVVLRLPPHRAEHFPGVPLRELASREHARHISAATLNKDASFVRSLFKWAMLRDYIQTDASAAIGKARVAAAQDQRHAFTDADLRRIFGPSFLPDTKGRPERYWIPLLLTYTGARLEEVAQLHHADFRKEAGIWCMSINTLDEGKRVKTAQSRRMVPLHSALLNKGLLKFLEGAPKGHLWPGLPLTSNGYGDHLGKWFNRRLKRLGFAGRRKVLHSLRHTFTTRLKAADVQEHTISELVGHKVQGMTMGRYGKGLKPAQLQAAVERLKLPV